MTELGWSRPGGDWLLTIGRDGDELVFQREHLPNVLAALDEAGVAGYDNPVRTRGGLTRLRVRGLTDLPGIRIVGARLLAQRMAA